MTVVAQLFEAEVHGETALICLIQDRGAIQQQGLQASEQKLSYK